MANTTHNLRKLLDDYYSGRVSNDMIREIRRLFSELPVVPPDLLVDQQIFIACEQLPETLPAAPARLTQLIDQTILNCQDSPHRNRSRLLRWIAASSAAAAMIAMFFSLGSNMDKSGQMPVGQSNQNQSTSMETKNQPPSENEPMPKIDVSTSGNKSQQLIAQADKKTIERKSSARANVQPTTAKTSNNEITDPVEAAQRLDAIFDMIENDIRFSAKTQSQAFDVLNLANEKVSTILTTTLQ